MIKGRDIVVVGQQPWDVEIGSNCKNIAIEFSRYNRVLYVNAPLDRITAWRKSKEEPVKKRLYVIQGKEKGLIVIDKNLWNLYPDQLIESINWIGSQSLFECLNRINNKRFAESIQKAIDQLGFKDFILFNDNDIFRCFHLKELLKPAVSVYYSRDFMLAVDYWKKHGKKLEPELIAQSDVCVANSTYLADYCKRYNPNSYYVGQGCDLEVFAGLANRSKPADMQGIVGPVIGYVGALLELRLNIQILLDIAHARADWNIVLVGQEDDAFKQSELHKMPNVFFLGSKTPDLLPQYIFAFDVALNPQVINEVTIGNYPRKIDEYLAMGKPVVATSTPFMEKIFSQFIYLGKSGADYIRLIEKALQENSEAKEAERVAFASSHTWENSVNEISRAIKEFI